MLPPAPPQPDKKYSALSDALAKLKRTLATIDGPTSAKPIQQIVPMPLPPKVSSTNGKTFYKPTSIEPTADAYHGTWAGSSRTAEKFVPYVPRDASRSGAPRGATKRENRPSATTSSTAKYIPTPKSELEKLHAKSEGASSEREVSPVAIAIPSKKDPDEKPDEKSPKKPSIKVNNMKSSTLFSKDSAEEDDCVLETAPKKKKNDEKSSSEFSEDISEDIPESKIPESCGALSEEIPDSLLPNLEAKPNAEKAKEVPILVPKRRQAHSNATAPTNRKAPVSQRPIPTANQQMAERWNKMKQIKEEAMRKAAEAPPKPAEAPKFAEATTKGLKPKVPMEAPGKLHAKRKAGDQNFDERGPSTSSSGADEAEAIFKGPLKKGAKRQSQMQMELTKTVSIKYLNGIHSNLNLKIFSASI